jgi:hypothetical protein
MKAASDYRPDDAVERHSATDDRPFNCRDEQAHKCDAQTDPDQKYVRENGCTKEEDACELQLYWCRI